MALVSYTSAINSQHVIRLGLVFFRIGYTPPPIEAPTQASEPLWGGIWVLGPAKLDPLFLYNLHMVNIFYFLFIIYYFYYTGGKLLNIADLYPGCIFGFFVVVNAAPAIC